MQNFDQLMAEKEDIIRSLEDLIKVKNDF